MNISFLGFQTDVSNFIYRSKVFVMTTHNEGIPVALLESAAQNVPAVVLSFDGANEVVKNGETGYVCDSLEEMCFCINKLLKTKSLRTKFGIQAEKYVRLNYGHACLDRFGRKVLEI